MSRRVVTQPGVSQNRNSNVPLFFILKRRACRRHRAPKLEFTFVSPLWRKHTPFALRRHEFGATQPQGINSNVSFFPQGQEPRIKKSPLSCLRSNLQDPYRKGHQIDLSEARVARNFPVGLNDSLSFSKAPN